MPAAAHIRRPQGQPGKPMRQPPSPRSQRLSGPAGPFLATKAKALRSRARRLVALSPAAVGLRPEDLRFSPSPQHFAAANRRLKSIDHMIKRRLAELDASPSDPSRRLAAMAMVEREVDRARRSFGMFFEIFSQRGTAFAKALAAHDAIGRDCYQAVRDEAPRLFGKRMLPPLTYMEHGYSPATMRRGVTLSRLLGEANPFPLIRIPWDRDRPWQATFLHEVAHNLQADLGLWVENKQAVARRLATSDPRTRQIWSRWHKEIFADLAALLLGGPAVAFGMAEFLAHPQSKVATFKPGGAHPTNLIRVPIMAEMLRRMRFAEDGKRLKKLWQQLYTKRRGHRLPPILATDVGPTIEAVVDEIAWQPRRNLAERALGDVIRFTRADQISIRRGAMALSAGRVPKDLAPRHLVSASRYAIDSGVGIERLSRLITDHLAQRRGPKPAARLASLAA